MPKLSLDKPKIEFGPGAWERSETVGGGWGQDGPSASQADAASVKGCGQRAKDQDEGQEASINDERSTGDFNRRLFRTFAALTFLGATAVGYGAFWIGSYFVDGRISALIGISFSAIACLIAMYCLETDTA